MAIKHTSLRNYFLTRTSAVGLDPYSSVMDLPKAKAERLLEGFRRTVWGNANYYDYRKNVENWLRNCARLQGVAVEHENPLYFTLTECDMTQSLDRTLTISLPASKTLTDKCSFTIADSFYNYKSIESTPLPDDVPRHRFLGRVFNAAQIEQTLTDHYIRYLTSQNGDLYVECQMWARPG